MKVAIYGRNFDKGFKEYVEKFFTVLQRNNIEIIIYDKCFEFLKKEIHNCKLLGYDLQENQEE